MPLMQVFPLLGTYIFLVVYSRTINVLTHLNTLVERLLFVFSFKSITKVNEVFTVLQQKKGKSHICFMFKYSLH